MKAKFLVLGLMLALAQIAPAQSSEIVTNKTVTDLYKAGLDSSIIISKIATSECKFDLSATQLVNLKKSGVPASIIKAMLDRSSNANASGVQPQAVQSTSGKVPVLNAISEVNYYDHNAVAAKPLEKGKAQLVDRGVVAKALYFKLDGATSSVKLPAKDSPTFLVKLTDVQGEPNAWFWLYKVDVKNGNRITLWAKALNFSKDPTGNAITFSDNSLGNGLFEMVPTKKLEKGEYFFVSKGSFANYGQRAADVFAFSIE